jgi:nucleoside-diphosphate-sugar epimerase
MGFMTRVLVAGAGGFIGGWLVKQLLAQDYLVTAIDVKPLLEWSQVHAGAENLSKDLSLLSSCLESTEEIDVIYNLAADMGGMGFIENNKSACMLSVLINTHLLMGARQNRVKKFFFSSSACVYNSDTQKRTDVTPLKESDAYPAMPEDGYGWEKLFSERMCRHFFEDFGIETRIGRFHNIYGPLGTWIGGREKAPAAICRKVAEAKILGKKGIEIWGDGNQTRSFTYIDDCILGTIKLTGSEINEPINIGSSEMVSINQLVDLAEKFAGITLTRNYNLSAPKGVRGRNSDNSKILNNLNWEPKITLEVGLEKTYHWIEHQVRKSLSQINLL